VYTLYRKNNNEEMGDEQPKSAKKRDCENSNGKKRLTGAGLANYLPQSTTPECQRGQNSDNGFPPLTKTMEHREINAGTGAIKRFNKN